MSPSFVRRNMIYNILDDGRSTCGPKAWKECIFNTGNDNFYSRPFLNKLKITETRFKED